MSAGGPSNTQIPIDTPAEIRPGVRMREADFHGNPAEGKRGIYANFPYAQKGDRGMDSLPVRTVPDGPGPMTNVRSGK